jgi:hypothetical protein
MLLIALGIFLPKLLLGFSVAHLIWKNQAVSAYLLKLALGIPVGMGISALGMFIGLLMGINLKIYSFVELFFALGLTFVVGYLYCDFQVIFGGIKKGSDRFEKYFLLAFAITFAAALAAYYLFAQNNQHGFEDAWLMWNLSARYLYRTGNLSILLPASHTFRYHPDYPLLVSLNIAWGWNILGIDTTKVQVVVAALFSFSITAILFTSLNFLRDVFQAIIVSVVALMTPWLIFLGTWQYADIPLSVYFLATGVMFAIYLRTRETGALVLAGLLSGFSAWTKNEGLLFLALSTIILALVLLKDRSIKKFIYLSGGLALPLVVTLIYKALIKTPTDLFSSHASFLSNILDLNRYSLIFSAFAKEINTFGGWPVSIWLVLAIYALIVRFEAQEKLSMLGVFLLIAAQFGGYFAIYLVTSPDLAWHLATSLNRLLTHLYPLGLFLLFFILKSPLRSFRQEIVNNAPSH